MTLNRSLSAFCWWLSCWCVWKLWLWCHRHDSRYSVRWLGTSWGLSSWVCSWKVICYRFKWMNLLDRQANTKNTRTVSLDKLHILLLPQPLQCSWGKWGVSGIKPAKISYATQQINRKFTMTWREQWELPPGIPFWHTYLEPWTYIQSCENMSAHTVTWNWIRCTSCSPVTCTVCSCGPLTQYVGVSI